MHNRNLMILSLIFFAVLFTAGVGVFKDYGLAWDELISRGNGIVTYNFVTGQDDGLFSYKDRYYGTAFEVVLIALERMFRLYENTKDVFQMRHLASFILFFIAVIFFYKICKKRFDSVKAGLAGAVMLALSPRIFADSFYNSKDLAFMSVFIIAVYYLMKNVDKPRLRDVVIFGLVSAFLADIRIMGIMIPMMFIAAAFTWLLMKKIKGQSALPELMNLAIYIVVTSIFMVAFWPVLWRDPIANIVNAFRQMAHFERWTYTVLYMGDFIKPENMPWHYVLVWMMITIPVFYLTLFLIGSVSNLSSFFRSNAASAAYRKYDAIFYSWLMIPIASVIMFRSIVYDGWRQLYFVYPAFVVFSVSGLRVLYRSTKNIAADKAGRMIRPAFYALIAFVFLQILIRMVRLHPYENLYFNCLAGNNLQEIKASYDMDYWGLSYRKALEYIALHDQRGEIKVCAANQAGELSAYILDPEDMARIVFVKNPYDADYFMTNYRWHPTEYDYPNEVYSYKIDGVKIAAVYKMD